MEKFLKFLFIGLILVVLSGCYQVMTIIKINKDGSGEIVETVMLDASFMGMGFNTQGSAENDIHDPQVLKDAAVNFGEGVSYVSSEKVEKDNLTGYKVTYRFDDLNNVKIDETFSGNIFSDDMGGLVDNSNVDKYITFNFKKGNNSSVTVKFPRTDLSEDEEFSEKEVKTSSEELEMMMAVMKDMKFSLELEFNGDIKKTDAKYHQGSNITLIDLDFAEMMKDKEKLNEFVDLPQDDSEKVIKFLEKNYPNMKYEPADEIFVELK